MCIGFSIVVPTQTKQRHCQCQQGLLCSTEQALWGRLVRNGGGMRHIAMQSFLMRNTGPDCTAAACRPGPAVRAGA